MEFTPLFVEKLEAVGIDPSKIYGQFMPPKYVRENPRKWKHVDLERFLKSLNISYKRVSWYPKILQLRGGETGLGRTEEFKSGFFYLQDVSSVLPVLALDPRPSERILDLCAAPGLKTSLMHDLTIGEAYIIAIDISEGRLRKLRQTIKQYGLGGITVVKADGRRYRPPIEYDKVLVDAPCSTEGKIGQFEDSLKTHWSSWKKIKDLTKVQKGLIRNGFRLLKSGGTLVYSTCSFPREENESVVEYLLKKEKNAEVREIEIPSAPLKQGLIEKTARIDPLKIRGNGGFIAKITKK
ncbi:RsmB/NOP family class I SAM-dependent RNA methyltransferase [Candidatus Altiarchaeota archaeon]